MAGDWIKMRTTLRSSPKVVRIASALKADRLRVIGGLHAVWCLFDAHSEDGQLPGYTLEALDEDIGWPGFSAAMMAVQWIESTDEGLTTPRFDEHNGQSAKRRCQEAERKRDARKASADDADKKRTREEKRREDKTNAPAEPLPEWVPQKAWNDYLNMRKVIKKPLTADAIPLAIAKLEKLKAHGNSPKDVLEQSTLNSWQGLFEVKRGASDAPATTMRKDWE
jgi:hypothetical protein